MNHLLLLAALGFPAAARAQQADVLRGSINPHGFILAHPAVLYRHLGDTLTNQPARRLHPGDDVVVQQDGPRWLKVVRGNGKGTGFSTDQTIYYLPVQALKGAQRFILL